MDSMAKAAECSSGTCREVMAQSTIDTPEAFGVSFFTDKTAEAVRVLYGDRSTPS